MWVAHVAEAGDNVVTTDRKVSSFIDLRLALGHGSEFGYRPWVFGTAGVVGWAALLAAAFTRRRPRSATTGRSPVQV
ncbi:MAG: hypothetical protein ACM4D3_08745 [Candidatus Sericytochromatia bacterium]